MENLDSFKFKLHLIICIIFLIKAIVILLSAIKMEFLYKNEISEGYKNNMKIKNLKRNLIAYFYIFLVGLILYVNKIPEGVLFIFIGTIFGLFTRNSMAVKKNKYVI